ncbi:hypothetical protein H2199_001346 [Coniosporium tulheliwenetii]|uniref:Uncharacterized protein n=1 Tax=Coniosporium tulheliwenetii TaxID=3383036 RepID=A0ACC2ZLZ6_9PEZI|nr:hypothetical protein H2199_001346 [Cladosporium sp. JES 115]
MPLQDSAPAQPEEQPALNGLTTDIDMKEEPGIETSLPPSTVLPPNPYASTSPSAAQPVQPVQPAQPAPLYDNRSSYYNAGARVSTSGDNSRTAAYTADAPRLADARVSEPARHAVPAGGDEEACDRGA